ncbi:MAG TPA: hypothetical protein VLE49_06930 [Anaerolineales bacterium]|nr:hypothetical protein [Anaerolineales bacterium]
MLFKNGKSFIARFVLILTLLGGTLGVTDVQASPLGEGNITTVLVTGSTGTPLAGKPVYAFDGNTYTGYSKATDANGEAALTLPEGAYRFRIDVETACFSAHLHLAEQL